MSLSGTHELRRALGELSGLEFPIPPEKLLEAVGSTSESNAALLLTNSYAEGFANSTSDCDVTLVSTHDVDECWRQESIANRRVDLHIVGLATVRDQFRKVFDEGLNLKRAEFVHKLLAGTPFFSTACWDDLLNGFDRSLFKKRLSDYYVKEAASRLEDIFGLQSVGRQLDAILNARYMHQEAFDAYLCMKGETLPKSKWRISKAQRVLEFGNPHFQAYLETELGPGPGAAPAPWIERVLSACRHAIADVYFPDASPQAITSGDGRAARYKPAAFSLVVERDGMYLGLAPSPRFRMGPESVAAYYSVVCSSEHEHQLAWFSRVLSQSQPSADHAVPSWEREVKLLAAKGMLLESA
jgi:hypothetical protein